MKARALDRRMMGHRWGWRIDATQSLALQRAHNARALGILLNASLGGAYGREWEMFASDPVRALLLSMSRRA
jgi:hypothetical protein